MVLLTPKFVFVAILASLTAFSLAPTADAAAIAMRRSNQHHISDSSETWSSSSLNHADHPVLPLPAHLMSASGKLTQDTSGIPSRGNVKRQSPRDFFASERRALTASDLPPLLTRRVPSHHNAHQPQEHASPPPETSTQQSGQEGSERTRPFVHINGANSHATFGRRAPDPHPDPRHSHGHDHHHHHGDHHDHHHHGSKADEVVVIEGDNDNVHIGRRSPQPDPHHHHHHHQHWRTFGGIDRLSVTEDKRVGRRSPDPRHDHHHHHDHDGHGHHKGNGKDKVIIKGDDNNVSVHSRSRMVRHQGPNHLRPPPEQHQSAASHEGHQRYARAREFISFYKPHHDGASADYAEPARPHGGDQGRKLARSVLINSVEGEEKYVVPDEYQDQRVTVIEGDGISKVLAKAKRGELGTEGVPGTIEIMSQSAKSENGQRIASLLLVQPDSTMSEFANSTWILNASENNQTQLYMVAMNTTDSGVQGEDVPVALKVPVFNPVTALMESYCATYDPSPPAPAPLSVESCFDAKSSSPHKSQVFAYTPSTSVVRPMWFSSETDDEDTLSDPAGSNSTVKPDAAVDPKTPLGSNMSSVTSFGDFGNSTAPPPSVAASLSNTTGIDEGLTESSGSGNDSMITPSAVDFAAKAQNVTLVFTPATLVVPSGSTKTSDLSSGLDDEMPMSDTNRTSTNVTASPTLTSDASGKFNDTETGWTGTMDGDELPTLSKDLPHSNPVGTVSPAAVPTGSSGPTTPATSSSEDGKDLNVMVGVAREETDMRAVSTAPYKWKFDRERV